MKYFINDYEGVSMLGSTKMRSSALEVSSLATRSAKFSMNFMFRPNMILILCLNDLIYDDQAYSTPRPAKNLAASSLVRKGSYFSPKSLFWA